MSSLNTADVHIIASWNKTRMGKRKLRKEKKEGLTNWETNVNFFILLNRSPALWKLNMFNDPGNWNHGGYHYKRECKHWEKVKIRKEFKLKCKFQKHKEVVRSWDRGGKHWRGRFKSQECKTKMSPILNVGDFYSFWDFPNCIQ